MDNNATIIKVSELNRYLKGLIQNDPLLRDLWVTGELSNFKHHRSGHMYFTLKDSSSSLRCVFFKRENMHCLFRPEDGMEVVLHGNINIYEPDGVYQFYVREMEPAGVGSLYLAFEQLKNRLETEGLFRSESKKNIPSTPQKIAIITSPSGAALQDILATIKKRFPPIHLLIVESLVQGPEASRDLVKALELLNRRDDIDLIILARGGGSIEDLWPFNEEVVARAIYNSAIPIISAIGHETDYTISDFVADYRAPTPTAAAVAAVPDYNELTSALKSYQQRSSVALQRRLQKEKQLLDQIVGERFFRLPFQRINRARENLRYSTQAQVREMKRQLRDHSRLLMAQIDQLDSYSPLKVMSRGYSYCRDEEGTIIRSVKDIKIKQPLKLTFRDGIVSCRTEKIEEGCIIGEEERA